MQLHLQFQCKELTLPISYRYIVQSLIYRLLLLHPEFSQRLHDIGHRSEGRTYKLFTFGPLQGDYSVIDKKICFHKMISLEIRSADPMMIQLLLSALPVGREVQLEHQTITVLRASLENFCIFQDRITVRTVSPVAANFTEASGFIRWFSPEEPEYFRLIERNACRKFKSLYPDAGETPFSICPAGTVFRKEVSHYKNVIVTAWSGQFQLTGSPQMLTLLYDCGIGVKSAQGYGMFQVLPEEGC